MKLLRFPLAPLAVAIVGGFAAAQTTWQVPGDFPSVALALSGAASGDTIVVGPGTWPTQNANWNNKDLILRSSAGPEVTILDGLNASRILNVQGAVTADSRIEGFTFHRGYSAGAGAIFLWGDVSPSIVNCVFRSNRASPRGAASQGGSGGNASSNGATGGTGGPGGTGLPGYDGGAVYAEAGAPTFENCVFYMNTAGDGGTGGKGGTGGQGGPGTLFVSAGKGGTGGVGGNGGAGGRGGAIATNIGNPVLINCFFRDNRAGRGGAGGSGGNGGPGGDGGIFGNNGPFGVGRSGTVGATGGMGGALAALSPGGGFVTANCTFVENRSGLGGQGGWGGSGVPSGSSGGSGAIGTAPAVRGYFGSNLTLSNNIFRAHVGTAPAIHWVTGSPPDSSHCVSDFTPLVGPGNIQADPLFDIAGDPWTPHGLLPGSPCIDAADGSLLASSVKLDARGKKRRVDDPSTASGALAGTPPLDIGAVEFQPAASFTELVCALNPAGSLVYVSGAATPGGTLQVALDNPLDTQGASLVFALVGVGGFASESVPCGLPVPGLGMFGPGASGGLAVDLGSSGTVPPQIVGLWTGASALGWSLSLPNLPQIVGLPLNVQGIFVEAVGAAVPIALTSAAVATIGS